MCNQNVCNRGKERRGLRTPFTECEINGIANGQDRSLPPPLTRQFNPKIINRRHLNVKMRVKARGFRRSGRDGFAARVYDDRSRGRARGRRVRSQMSRVGNTTEIVPRQSARSRNATSMLISGRGATPSTDHGRFLLTRPE